MHGFSTVDGFVEINECLAEMMKYVANEPSVGLYYVQQHTQNAVPNVIKLRNKMAAKSHETTLHTEDSEDSITMVSSMKACGSPIADEMIRDIKKSLSLISTKQPRKGLINNRSSGFHMGRTSSWGPATWGRSSVHGQQNSESAGNLFSNVFKSAKEKASNLKWPQLDPKEAIQAFGGKPLMYPTPPLSAASASTSSSLQDMEAEELRLSSAAADDTLEGKEMQVKTSLPDQTTLSLSETFEDFKADREAKLKEWLEESERSGIEA